MAGFCARAESLAAAVVSGELKDPAFSQQRASLVGELADIFNGRNPDYLPIAGYHGGSLPWKLRVDLGEYFERRQADYRGDAVAVLFDWLFAHIVDGMAASHGDDAILSAHLAAPVKYAAQVLQGVEQRQHSDDELALPDLD